MKFTILSDIGVVRSENQDKASVFVKDGMTLAILCDGMGGHSGGSHASRITIETFEREFNKGINSKKIDSWFMNTINKTRKQMKSYAGGSSSLLDMGTTITAAIVCDKTIYIFNIGDSRTYVYNGLLHKITKDHNLRNYYIDKYNYSQEEAAKVMGAAALTSALGPEKNSTIDPYLVEIDDNLKYIVLTSDGIHDYISKPVFEKVLSESISIEEKAEKIVRKSIQGKSSDNLTIIIVDMEEQNDRNS